MKDSRINNEIAHGKLVREAWKGNYYYWETPAGKVRWNQRVKMLTDHITPKMNVLEIGTGTGCFTKAIAETKAKITSIDISPDLIEVAIENIKEPNVTFKIENAYALTYQDSSFDTIIGSSVLHHLEIEKALKEFYRVLKPGGTIYFTEPNMLNPQVFIERNIPFVKRYFMVSPDETAFIRWKLFRKIQENNFKDIKIVNFDFLHPSTPKPFIPMVKRLGEFLEQFPLTKEITGSLYIHAVK